MKTETEGIPEGEYSRPLRRLGVSEPILVNREAYLRPAEDGGPQDWMTEQSEIVELSVGVPKALLPRLIEVKIGVSRIVRVRRQFSGPQHLVRVSVRRRLPKARRRIEVRRGGDVGADETDQRSERAEGNAHHGPRGPAVQSGHQRDDRDERTDDEHARHRPAIQDREETVERNRDDQIQAEQPNAPSTEQQSERTVEVFTARRPILGRWRW